MGTGFAGSHPFLPSGPQQRSAGEVSRSMVGSPVSRKPSPVEYLRAGTSQGRFEIMLHGYHHDEPTGRGEFAGGQDLEKKVAEGHNYLRGSTRCASSGVCTAKEYYWQGWAARNRSRGSRSRRNGRGQGRMASAFATHVEALAKTSRDGEKPPRPGIPWVLNLGDHREIPGNPSPRVHRSRPTICF